jgi:hypothetical protein
MLKAFRLKPAPGNHVGMYFTNMKGRRRECDLMVIRVMYDELTSWEEVDDHGAWAAGLDGPGGCPICGYDELIIDGLDSVSIGEFHDGAGCKSVQRRFDGITCGTRGEMGYRRTS